MAAEDDPLVGRQWHLGAINVFPVWQDYSGAGIRVGVADTGVQRRHPDLDDNYDPSLEFNYRDGVPGGDPVRASDNHGTAVAGLIAAERGNGIGGAGVAFGASITSLVVIPSDDPPDAEVFRDAVALDVMNNSWSNSTPFADDFLDDPALREIASALEGLVRDGRGGLGTVVVFSAGNERQSHDDVNYHNLGNSRFTIAVAASDRDGDVATFSNPGAALLVTAPGGSGDIVTTDRTGKAGYERGGDYTFHFGGTSAAAPIVSGVVALMLEANPALGYRDVQEILAYSARQTGGDAGWRYNGADNSNGGGLHVSHDFGFGLVDAHAAVRLAETWQAGATHDNEVSRSDRGDFGPGLLIPDLDSVTVSLAMPALDIDQVEIVIALEHSFLDDLEIRLISPDGTGSLLMDHVEFGNGEGRWLFSSTRHWGESTAGEWQLTIDDTVRRHDGQFNSWKLTLYGDAVDADDVYVFTDEYADVAGAGARSLLRDPGGIDVLNAAPVSSDLLVDMSPGAVSQIAGAELTIGRGTTIEQAIGGDGNDRLLGNDADNRLLGQRGDDTLSGAGGADSLEGGAGADTLLGGAGPDDLDGGAGSDLLFGNRGGDLLLGGAEADELRGGRGNDRLAGGRADDLLSGGDGDDEILGGRGADTMLGGAGRDDFRYTDLDERGDRIADFTLGPDGDRLLIGDLLQGYDPATSPAADFVALVADGDTLRVRIDVDGQGDDPVGLVTLEGAAGATLDGMLADGNLVLTVASA